MRVNAPVKTYRVDIVEYERGWGSKIVDSHHFDNAEEAKQFTKDYNTKYNPPGPTPDWYMIAQYVG